MADIDQLTDVLTKLELIIGGLSTTLNSFVDKLVTSGDAADKWSDKIQQGTEKANRGIIDMSKRMQESTDSIDIFEKLSEAIDNASDSTVQLATAVGSFSGLTDTILPLSEGFKKIGESAKTAGTSISDQAAKLTATFDKFDPTGFLSKRIGTVAANIDNIKNVETALLKVEAQSGHLDKAMQVIQKDLSGMDQYMDQFSQQMFGIGEATGLTSDAVSEYALALKQIPGAMDQTVKVSDAAGGRMDFLTAAIKVSRGTIQDMNAVIDIFNDRWKQFGYNGKDALTIISEMHSASQELQLPFSFMKGTVQDISQQFQYFGDNAEGAIKIMKGLGRALTESGLGPQTMSQLVQNVTKQISNLDIAQKAFLSAQSGGPGGLRGGFQIQQLLQEGKLDEVYKKMEQALRRQFGGRIVSLEEAGKDSGAASQLTKQIAFLRQGPFGQLAPTEAEAIKLLQAIKHGTDPAKKTDGEKDLNAAVGAGNELQKRQETILSHIQNRLERGNQILGQILYTGARQVVGREGGGSIEGIIRASTKFGEDLALKSTEGQVAGYRTPMLAAKAELKSILGDIKEVKDRLTSPIPKAETTIPQAKPTLPPGDFIVPAKPTAATLAAPILTNQEMARQGMEMLGDRPQHPGVGVGRMIHEMGRKPERKSDAVITEGPAAPGKTSEANVHIHVDGQKLVTLAVKESMIRIAAVKNNNNQGIKSDFADVNVKIGGT